MPALRGNLVYCLSLRTTINLFSTVWILKLSQPEELTLLLIQLRRQQAELNSAREHTLAQLTQLKLEARSPQVSVRHVSVTHQSVCPCHCIEREPGPSQQQGTGIPLRALLVCMLRKQVESFIHLLAARWWLYTEAGIP
jgi:hypothetical protein